MKNSAKSTSRKNIFIIKNGICENAVIEYEGGKPTLHLLLNDETRKSYTALDLYDCFGLLRADLKDIKFLCKGAKINAHTSGMSSHMSNGLIAYELTMGQANTELVHILALEENNLTNDIQEQHDFCQRWSESVPV
ncbi:hypothetical protein [Pseudomonas fluorescens]|uniref:Uncharacterized protein n=2 Tax=Pseudomonas fluorescens TaxID=294 RepID=A0ABY1TFY9_PSEFL|nr:hypothetical protein [Pseudomonas fluorescens]MCI4605892.1 hypothetical protein [Pseudomonas fluorescens]RFP92747.1 hypothetical protein D0N73_30320 [Pseudomonas fluorescens]TWR43497.1 hypothetical protein FIP59_28920 [Pseudomonas fluorescens]UKJ70902.1 hypothetical protein H1Q68_10585 [Pseudomonas fluorescens]SNY11825.1 hypothetical protein SAMN04488487_4368 [Pseudomonas fluorescens]